MKSHVIAATLSGGIILGALSSCSKPAAAAAEAGAPQETPEVGFVTVNATEVTLTTDLPGRLEAYRQAEVRARVPGIVTARTYEEGQEVKEGTQLFKIDPAPMKAAADAADAKLQEMEANHASAVDKLERYQNLASSQAISERNLREATSAERQAAAQILSAKAELEMAKLKLEYATVTSPISGRARRANVTEGALVGEGSATLLTTVEQIDPIYVNFSQPSAEVLALQRAVSEGRLKGLEKDSIKVELVLGDGSVYPAAGKLLFSDLAVEPTTDSIAMRALFPNPDRALLPGMYMRVKMDRAVDKRAFLVPRVALVRSPGSAQLMILDDKDEVIALPVVADTMQEGKWLVTSGLKGGERVVVENAGFLMPGMKVKPVAAK